MFKLRITRSILTYISIFTFFVLFYSFIFQYMMRVYENRDFEFVTGIYWVIMSMTTVGYGDIYFKSLAGQVFSIVVALSGIIIIFGFFFPLVVTPSLERTMRKELPKKVPPKTQQPYNHMRL